MQRVGNGAKADGTTLTQDQKRWHCGVFEWKGKQGGRSPTRDAESEVTFWNMGVSLAGMSTG